METPKLTWIENHTPFSEKFGDIYYSTAGGLEEKQHVFLKGNRLPERWLETPKFIMTEIGFGMGLNFLVTYEAWKKNRLSNGWLQYLSIERYPLTAEQIRMCLLPFPGLHPLSQKLCAQLPPPIRGFHRLHFWEDQLSLTLIYEDAEEALSELAGISDTFIHAVDAWYLDGFSPQKNPELWTPSLCEKMAALSSENSTLTTYSAASQIRKNLNHHGFKIYALKGFQKKREMTLGIFTRQQNLKHSFKTGFNYPTPPKERTACIVGGGLSGTSLAWALKKRGWEITLFEKEAAIATKASGNQPRLLHPYWSRTWEVETLFYMSAFFLAKRWLSTLLQRKHPISHDFPGTLFFPEREKDQCRYSLLAQTLGLPDSWVRFLSVSEVNALTGLIFQKPALFLKEGGWIQISDFSRSCVEDAGLEPKTLHEIHTLDFQEGEWCLNQKEKSPCVIFCQGEEISRLPQAAGLPLQRIRGQRTSITNPFSSLTPVLCASRFLLPRQNFLDIGATYDLDDFNENVSEESHLENIRIVEKDFGIFEKTPTSLGGDVCFRVISPDRRPLIGPLPHQASFLNHYQGLQKGLARIPATEDAFYPGLYVHTAHGSRGLLSCLAGAELLAAHLNHEISPFPKKIVEALHPARFLVRKLLKGIKFD